MNVRAPSCRALRGFTVVELLVVIALVAVLARLVAPSFRSFLAKQRVEGVASELVTDLQYARSESVTRNVPVRVTFIGTDCYVIHQESLAVTTCTTTADPALLKTVQISSGSTASFTSVPAFVAFEPVRGTASTSGSVTVSSSVGTRQLQVDLSALGRVHLCSPSGTVAGYSTC